MSFFKRFFSCGSQEEADAFCQLVPAFCLPKKTNSGHSGDKASYSMMAGQAKLGSVSTNFNSMVKANSTRLPPPTRFL